MSHLAALALVEWQQRLAFARKAAADGRWSPVEADARLMPWLAVALLAGAEPPEAASALEDIRLHEPDGRTHARGILAGRLCPCADMRAELARSRDAAVTAALAAPTDQARSERSTRLQYLAIFLGCPNTQPARPEPAEGPTLQEAA